MPDALVLSDITAPQSFALIGVVAGLVLVALQGMLVARYLGQNGNLLIKLDSIEGMLGDAALIAAETIEQDMEGQDSLDEDEGTTPLEPAPRGPERVGTNAGDRPPHFSLPAFGGGTLSFEALIRRGRPLGLFFLDTESPEAKSLLPEIGRLQRIATAWITVGVIAKGPEDDVRRLVESNRLRDVAHVADDEAMESLGVTAAPAWLLVGRDSTVAEPLNLDPEAIRAKLGLLTLPQKQPTTVQPGPSTDPNALKPGDPVPTVRLPRLDGKGEASLADFSGKRIVAVFWTPGCHYCLQLLEDMRTWEREKGPDAPELFVVTRSTPTDHDIVNLASTVVADSANALGRTFGQRGTPATVLIAEDGTVETYLHRGYVASQEVLRKNR